MRTIKFRAWDKEKKIMWLPHDLYDISSLHLYSTDDGKYELPNVIPMQFTGLQDKKGKDIYEGDVIKTYCEITNREIIGEIEYADKWCTFYLGAKNDYGCGMASDSVFQWYYSQEEKTEGDVLAEIIGNIHENPELLG